MTSASVANFVRRNPSARAATELLDEAGVPWTLAFGGKHPKIHFSFGGRNHVHPVAISPSDPYAFKVAARDVRHILAGHAGPSSEIQETAMAADPKNALQLMFEGQRVRVADRDGSPWFVANDVCAVLEISDARQAIGKLDEDERGGYSIPTPSGAQEMRVVSESGLYTLILRSRDATTPGTLPHRFRKWVTGEVLPSLRKHGGYSTDPAIMDLIKSMSAEISEVRAYADLALEAARKVETALADGAVSPTVDLATTVTADEMVAMAGVPKDERQRGTSRLVTARMLKFTLGHGCFRTPEHLNASMPWRFPREKAQEWLYGPSLGGEQIRSQVAERQRSKARKGRESGQIGLSLVPPSQPGAR